MYRVDKVITLFEESWEESKNHKSVFENEYLNTLINKYGFVIRDWQVAKTDGKTCWTFHLTGAVDEPGDSFSGRRLPPMFEVP